MIRSGHLWYDLREALASLKILFALLVMALLFIIFLRFQFLYAFALFFAVIYATRGLIGRRCPTCDGPLKEIGAERDKENAFVMNITWQCPRDGYTENERLKGDSGLFGVN
jgi:hypothetical protein